MTKRDRAKMVRRLSKRFDYKALGPDVCWEIETAVAREVDRAVRAERRAQRIATEEANKWREEAMVRAREECIGKFGMKL